MTPPHAEWFSAAAHEAGHAVAFMAAGIRPGSVTLSAAGDFAEGTCEVSDKNIPDIEKFLIAILAGQEAQARWLVTRGGRWFLGSARSECDAKDDLKHFKRFSRGTGHSEPEIRRKAEKFVASNWGKIERLGNRLAKDGKLPVSAL